MPEPEPTLPFSTRFWFAWSAFFRLLLDGAFAARVFQAREPAAALPPAPQERVPEAPKAASAPAAPSTEPALQLLAVFQREGRLVDFLEQDIVSFSDAEIGVAARVVHEGCRKALRSHTKLEPIRTEEESSKITLPAGYRPAEVKLSGNVQGSAPYQGVLRHRGWRAVHLSLPTPVKGHDPSIIAPAEVEL